MYDDLDLDLAVVEMEIERIFHFGIPDKEMEKIKTLGQLQKAILSRIETVPSHNQCIGQHVFYELRRFLGDYFNLDPRTIRPGTLTEDIIPRNKRRIIWRDLAQQSGFEFPILFPSERFSWICLAFYVAACLFVMAFFPPLRKLILGWAILGALPTILLATLYEKRFAPKIPECCATVGGLAKAIKAYNLPKISNGRFTEEDVLDAISNLMACGFNLEYDDVDVPAETEIKNLGSTIFKKRKERLKIERARECKA
jgi:hypothetical protein